MNNLLKNRPGTSPGTTTQNPNKPKTKAMKELTKAEVNYLQELINSLQYECDKAKQTGTISQGYIKEKTDKIQKLIK